MLAAESILTGGKLLTENRSKDERETQLDIQSVEEKQRGISQAEKAQSKEARTFSQQKANASVSGLSGPSFGAIERSSFDAFLNDEDNIFMNTQFREQALNARKDDLQKSRNASMFGTLSNFGMEAFKILRNGDKGK